MAAPSSGSDEELPSVSNEDLDRIFDAVTHPDAAQSASADGFDDAACIPRHAVAATAASTASRRNAGIKRRASVTDPLPIGIRAGDTTFEVPELIKRARTERVLPEDGTWVDRDQDSSGGRYGARWMKEEINRKNTLQKHPDYQFLKLVAGASNTRVERLYDEDSVGEDMRAQVAEQQARLSVQEAQTDLASLDTALTKLREEQDTSERLIGRVTERQRTDGLLMAAPRHVTAVQDYVEIVRANRARIDDSNVVERWASAAAAVPVAADMGSLYKRVLDRLLTEVDEDMGVQDIPSSQLAQVLIWPRRGTRGQKARDMLLDLFGRGFPRQQLEGAEASPLGVEEVAADEEIPPVMELALGRLLTLRTHAIEGLANDRRGEFVDAFVTTVPNDRDAAFIALTLATDRNFRTAVLGFYRDRAWRSWLDEARAVAEVLESGAALLRLEAPLSSPGRRGALVFKTSDVLAAEEAIRVERQMRARGATDDEIRGERRFARENILENPPNRIMAISNTTLDQYADMARDVRVLLGPVGPGSLPLPALRQAGILGSPGLDDDRSLMALLTLAQSDFTTERERQVDASASSLTAWARAMSWYEDIGGTLFVDLDTDFPADSRMRAAQRAGREIAPWGVELRRAPPRYSAPMRVLWDRHVPDMRAVQETIEAALVVHAKGAVDESQLTPAHREAFARLLASARVPPLTSAQHTVYKIMSGGVDPEQAALTTQDRIITRGPLVVFAVRLYRTELEVDRLRLEREIAQRRRLMESTRARMDALTRGEPIVHSAPMLPYQHRRGWVEQPEHSGIVEMIDIVPQAIGEAWTTLMRWAPNITNTITLEDAQRDLRMRHDLAKLVAVHMSMIAQSWPKQYLQLRLRTYSKIDLVDVVERFRKNYELTPTGRGPPPRPPTPRTRRDARWVATVKPSQGVGSRGGGLFVL